MKIKFKKQAYQTIAVEAVADCFAGQPKSSGIQYRIDPGVEGSGAQKMLEFEELAGFKNADIGIPNAQILKNIQDVQRHQNLPLSTSLVRNNVSPINLDIEMETGTGKTYCYIKTMFELNRRYGWSKFIVVVPSIAIREGVHKSFEMTADHFLEDYGKRARYFIYNSKQLHNLESFSSDSGINVIIINVQAFNATGIYDGDWRDYNTGLFFVKQAARLRDVGIPRCVISGNHDAANRMTRSLRMPDNVTFFSDEAPETAIIPGVDVAIHGQSYATSAVFEDLSDAYPNSKSGLLNIGLLHTCVTGREGHDRYAPCSVEGLKLKGYDYWALGHVHVLHRFERCRTRRTCGLRPAE
jgi:hypothetical protein